MIIDHQTSRGRTLADEGRELQDKPFPEVLAALIKKLGPSATLVSGLVYIRAARHAVEQEDKDSV